MSTLPRHFTVCVCGHTHHGKSTLIGRLLVELGVFSQRDVEKAVRLVEENRLGSHPYAVLVHRIPQERRDGHTVFPHHAEIGSQEIDMTIVDTPGHERYLRNKIYGIYQADYAILAVDASEGMARQTFETLNVLKAFDIPVLAATVTRCDYPRVGYSKDRFEEVSAQIRTALEEVRLGGQSTPVFPTSATEGEGVAGYSRIQWFEEGQTLVSVLKGALPVELDAPEATRVTVEGKMEVFAGVAGRRGIVVGMLEAGELRVGDELVLQPASTYRSHVMRTTARSVQVARGAGQQDAVAAKASALAPRRKVSVELDIPGKDLLLVLRHGGVLGAKNDPPSVCGEFDAEIVVTEWPTPITTGFQVSVCPHALSRPGRISAILEVHTEKGQVTGARASFLRAQQQARITIKMDEPLPIEADARYHRMSRFLLTAQNRVMAYGRCCAMRP